MVWTTRLPIVSIVQGSFHARRNRSQLEQFSYMNFQQLPTTWLYMPEYLHQIRKKTWNGNSKGYVNMPPQRDSMWFRRSEIGSGLNGNRKRLIKLLENPSVSTIVVEHRDRLARFGWGYIIAALKAANRTAEIANEIECKDGSSNGYDRCPN